MASNAERLPMTNDQLPERDPTKTNAQQGLYGKFRIDRTDGSSAPGGKHHGCDYFVLDVTHDKHAQAALAAYADAAEATHPQLAADMRARWRLPVPTADHAPIARITIGKSGAIFGPQHLYAPGLPPGEHDLWCVPVRAAAQPAGDAAMPVVATWRERVKHLDRPTDFAGLCAALEEARDLRWALQDAYARIASKRTEWGAEVAALTAQVRHAEAEAAKSERRAIVFGDALHRNILAMRAALADSHKHGPHHGMHWIVNTLAGPGQLPYADDVALGGQALFDKEVAEHESFRATHPGPAAPDSASEAAGVAACVTCGAPVDVPSTGASNRGPDPSCVWGPEHLAPRPAPGLEFDHRGVLVPVSPAPRDTAAMLAEHMVHVGDLEMAASAARQFQVGTVPNPIEALRAARDAVEASAKRMLGIL